jgi:hypothetical protein
MVALKELKQLIKHFKANECPRLGQKKAILYKFAEEHGLLKEEMKVVEHHKKEKKEEAKVEKKAEPKPKKKKLSERQEILQRISVPQPKTKKEMNAEMLKKVQEIRKEKGVSLKEAWALAKN